MTIKKIKGGYGLYSKTTGKKLGKTFPSREKALKRERQIQFFKNNEKYKKDHGGRGIPMKRRKSK